MPVSKHRRRRGRIQPGSRSSDASLSLNRPKPKANWWYISASAIIAFLVIAGFVVGGASFGARGGDSETYVKGIGTEHQIMPTRRHISEGTKVEYNTVPPTSGDHYARWAECGFEEFELVDERVVHNLEHGNIVISYNLEDTDEIDQLRKVFDDIGPSKLWGVARPYDAIPTGTIVAAAWGISDTMTTIDKERLEKFFDTYAGNLGPERLVCTESGVMAPPTS